MALPVHKRGVPTGKPPIGDLPSGVLTVKLHFANVRRLVASSAARSTPKPASNAPMGPRPRRLRHPPPLARSSLPGFRAFGDPPLAVAQLLVRALRLVFS